MNFQTATEAQKFGSDVIWVALSQALISSVGIIVLPALTKSYSVEIYGIWAQTNVTVALLTMILALGLGTAVQRFLAGEENREKRRHAFSAMYWTVFTFACLVLLISVLLRQNLSLLLFASPQYALFVPLTFLWALVNATFSLSASYLVARGKIKMLSAIQLAISLASMTLIITLATAGCNLWWVISSLIIAQAFFMVINLAVISRELGFPKPNFKGMSYFLAFSVPLIPSLLLFWIIDSSDRYFITHLANLSQAGIYSASYNLANITQLFYSPICFILFPILSRFWDQNETSRVRSHLEYSMKLFLVLAIPGSVGLYILSQPLLNILTTYEYAVGGVLVFLISLGIILQGIYMINVYMVVVAKQTKWLPLMIAVAALTNIVMNLALIPRVGVIGAAISTLVSYFVLAAIVTVWARRIVNYTIDIKFLAKVVLSAALMAFCLNFIEIGSALSIVLSAIAGTAVFGVGLLLLKVFSREDRRLIREILAGVNVKLWMKEFAAMSKPSAGKQENVVRPEQKIEERAKSDDCHLQN